MKKRWIITGAAGHLGTALLHCLAQGEDEVRAFVLAGEKPFCAPNIHVYTGDVTQPQTLQPLFDGAQECETYVLHAAGMVSIATGCRAQLERINVGGTQKYHRLLPAHGRAHGVYQLRPCAAREKKRR